MWDKLARRLLQPINTSVISILGFFNCLLGLWVMLPFDSLGEYKMTIFPEGILGFLTLSVGVTILIGSIKENFNLLATGSVMAFIYWFTMTITLVISNWKSPAWIVGLMIAFYSGFVYANVSVNSKVLISHKK